MSENQEVETRKLWVYGLGIIIVATAINVIIFLIADGAGYFDGVINPQTDAAPGIIEVIFSSIGQSIAGLVVFFLLVRFTSKGITYFRIVGTLVLIGSFALPFTLQDYTIGSVVALSLMHIVAGLGLILVLPYFLKKP